MARQPRMDYEGALYHVTTRGNRRERIVWDETDYGVLQKMMIEAMEWSGARLFSRCLMPNQVHVLVQRLEASVSIFMQRWLTRYARYFNWRHKLVGHVFQGRFKARLCQEEVYFKELVRYIHLNPYRVKVAGFVGPNGGKWSSDQYYQGTPPPESCRQGIKEGLAHFGQNPDSARASMRSFWRMV